MHEIVHLSLSSTANHVHSHFYNAQESYFVYSEQEAAESKVNPHVLFKSGKAPTPRGLIWEMRGGYGAMRGFNHPLYDYDRDSEGKEVDNSIVWNSSSVDTVKQQSIPKSEYQVALDQGQKTLPELNPSNTLYWSDYLHIYYHPNSLLTLPNWEYHPIEYPKGRTRGAGNTEFKDYSVGMDQYTELDQDGEYLETHFRPILESTDSLSGVSLSTEIDSGWGGFTSGILSQLRDDYIPKATVFTWGFYDDDSTVSRQMQLSRVKTTSSLVENSSIFIPMGTPSLPVKFDRQIDISSNYHRSALYNVVFESFSLLSSLRNEKRVSMQEIAEALQFGSRRNIAAGIHGAIGDSGLIDFSAQPFRAPASTSQQSHIFSKVGMMRSPAKQPSSAFASSLTSALPQQNIRDLYFNPTAVPKSSSADDLWGAYFGESSLLDNGTPKEALTRYENPQPASIPSSYPSGLITPEDNIYSDLSVSNTPKETLRSMAGIVKKYMRGDDDREELEQSLNSMADEYQWGYDSENEVSDSDLE